MRNKQNLTLLQRLFRLAAGFIMFLVALFAGFVLLIYMGMFGPIPDADELTDIRHQEASVIYTSDGELMGRYYLQNRDRVAIDEISPDFIDALIAIEDIRFHNHHGLDYRAMGRVLVRTMILQQDAGGGSTLSQQLAKNLYPRQGYSWFYIAVDKVREIIIARKMERLYSKEEILELYVNTVSFGEDTWGIKTASERFFNVSPGELDLHQAATLAGMLRATTFYNPRRNPENARHRRNVVIRQMERYGMIESGKADEAVARPLDLDYNRLTYHEGMAPHFRRYLQRKLQHILNTRPALDGNDYNLFTDGLVIETTVDSRVQQAAEFAVETNLKRLQAHFDQHREEEYIFDENDPIVRRAWQSSERYHRMQQRGYSDEEIKEALDTPVEMELFTWEDERIVTATPRDSIRHYLSFLNSGFMAMDPASGDVKAWVGGIHHNAFQYDHVRARRQTGSAFKPIVYAAALEEGIRPCDYKRNQLSTYISFDDWTPTNLEEEYGGRYSVQAALARSVNTITVELLRETGVNKVRETARNMGIQSRIPTGPAVALGTAEVSLHEMIRAYSAFANRGKSATPRYITAIYNADGELIYDFNLPEPFTFDPATLRIDSESAFSEETAGAMVQMLAKAVDEGTASGLRTHFGLDHAIAGKTGTTQNFTDGWFVGMTPDLVFGTWVGGVTPGVRFPEDIGFASQTALPATGYFLQELNNHEELEPMSAQFHDHQQNSSWRTQCEDYQDDRFTDRVRDFFTGNDPSEARIIDDEKEDKSVIDRVRGWFSRD